MTTFFEGIVKLTQSVNLFLDISSGIPVNGRMSVFGGYFLVIIIIVTAVIIFVFSLMRRASASI